MQDFPEEGALTPGGTPTYGFAKFSQKLYEIERIWTPGGGGAHPSRAPLGPPLSLVIIVKHLESSFLELRKVGNEEMLTFCIA